MSLRQGWLSLTACLLLVWLVLSPGGVQAQVVTIDNATALVEATSSNTTLQVHNIGIRNSGGGFFNVLNITQDGPDELWFMLTHAALPVAVTAGTSTPLKVEVNTTTLTAGIYKKGIVINTNIGTAVANITINVTAEVDRVDSITFGGVQAVGEGVVVTSQWSLKSRPPAPVRIEAIQTSGNAGTTVAFVSSVITFTQSNYLVPQTLSWKIDSDFIAQGARWAVVAFNYTVGDAATNAYNLSRITTDPMWVNMSIVDDDTPAVIVQNPSISLVEGRRARYAYVRLGSRPTADVLVTMPTHPQLTFAMRNLTFTNANWNISQAVNVSSSADEFVEGSQVYTAAFVVPSNSTDPSYVGLYGNTMFVTVEDESLPVTRMYPRIGPKNGGGVTIFSVSRNVTFDLSGETGSAQPNITASWTYIPTLDSSQGPTLCTIIGPRMVACTIPSCLPGPAFVECSNPLEVKLHFNGQETDFAFYYNYAKTPSFDNMAPSGGSVYDRVTISISGKNIQNYTAEAGGNPRCRVDGMESAVTFYPDPNNALSNYSFTCEALPRTIYRGSSGNTKVPFEFSYDGQSWYATSLEYTYSDKREEENSQKWLIMIIISFSFVVGVIIFVLCDYMGVFKKCRRQDDREVKHELVVKSPQVVKVYFDTRWKKATLDKLYEDWNQKGRTGPEPSMYDVEEMARRGEVNLPPALVKDKVYHQVKRKFERTQERNKMLTDNLAAILYHQMDAEQAERLFEETRRADPGLSRARTGLFDMPLEEQKKTDDTDEKSSKAAFSSILMANGGLAPLREEPEGDPDKDDPFEQSRSERESRRNSQSGILHSPTVDSPTASPAPRSPTDSRFDTSQIDRSLFERSQNDEDSMKRASEVEPSAASRASRGDDAMYDDED